MVKGLNATGRVLDQISLYNLEIDIVQNDNVTELFINATAYIWDDKEVGMTLIFFFSLDSGLGKSIELTFFSSFC